VAGRIIFEPALEKHIAIVRLDNPGHKNAIDLEMWHQLAEVASRIADHTSVRVVIITGSAEVFSSGADITDFNSARSDEVSGQSYDDLVEKTCRKVEAVPQPTICAIEGLCVGAGASLACSCDLRLASEKTAFLVPAARLGLGYDMRGIARFIRVFGHSATASLLLTAAKVPAVVAHSLGAVHSLHAPTHVEAAALELAKSVSTNAPLTIRAAKLSLHAFAQNDDELKRRALEVCALADGSEDYREGRAAFRAGRRPVFQGH
jgi:enoyl-CoA hydratase/carnithine racemase